MNYVHRRFPIVVNIAPAAGNVDSVNYFRRRRNYDYLIKMLLGTRKRDDAAGAFSAASGSG